MGRRFPIRRDTLREDSVAGVVLGVQSVPDGLATGLLAGVNPLAGLYAYMVGTFTGALITSSSFMAIQGTGAMAMIVADVPGLHRSADAERALVTLSILTGVIMLAAGLLKLGWLLRFVSNAVMVGFINAVGVNIVLGQLANFTGYDAEGANRVVRAFNTLAQPGPARSADPRHRDRHDRPDPPVRADEGRRAGPGGGRGDHVCRRAACSAGRSPRSTTSASSPAPCRGRKPRCSASSRR